MSIYQDMVNAGVPVDSHESDLYALKNDASMAIVENYEFKSNVDVFRSLVDGKLWYDIPFAYDPFWEKKAR